MKKTIPYILSLILLIVLLGYQQSKISGFEEKIDRLEEFVMSTMAENAIAKIMLSTTPEELDDMKKTIVDNDLSIRVILKTIKLHTELIEHLHNIKENTEEISYENA
jgi:hypothetical protein